MVLLLQSTVHSEGWASRDHRREITIVLHVTVQLCQTFIFIYDSVLRHAQLLDNKQRSVLFRNVMHKKPQKVARLSRYKCTRCFFA